MQIAIISCNCRKLCKDVKSYVQRAVDSGKEINLPFAIKSGTVTKGLKYSLATGNWGAQGTQGVRAGVSQVRTARVLQGLEGFPWPAYPMCCTGCFV
jgi:DNA-directed RNA polymerase beta subunit